MVHLSVFISSFWHGDFEGCLLHTGRIPDPDEEEKEEDGRGPRSNKILQSSVALDSEQRAWRAKMMDSIEKERGQEKRSGVLAGQGEGNTLGHNGSS